MALPDLSRMRCARHLGLLLLSVLGAVRAHVPTYGAGADNCFTPPHHHDTSQVTYLKGSGGLEIHVDSLTEPFDIAGGEVIDVDAVFKFAYDQSSYNLYIGCGGCVASVDPLVIAPVHLDGYEPVEVEPFTQTAYRSVFNKTERKYDTSALASCAENHFTIRVVDYHNRTGAQTTLVWGAVIGLGERFTFVELLSFPLYVLRNHGDSWTGQGWTWWFTLSTTVLGWWGDRRLARRLLGWRFLSPFDRQMTLEPRAWLCDLAIISFIAVMVEELLHLIYAQSMAAWTHGFWVGLVAVILFSNGLPIMVQCFVWWGLYHRDDDEPWAISHGWWWPLEFASGFGWLFLFGAGFYLGPAFVMTDALVRAYEYHSGWRAPRLDRLMERAGYPPQYGGKAEHKVAPYKTVRSEDDAPYGSGRPSVPALFF